MFQTFQEHTSQEQEEYDAQVIGLQENMGANEFSYQWAAGRTITVEQAMQVAFKMRVD